MKFVDLREECLSNRCSREGMLKAQEVSIFGKEIDDHRDTIEATRGGKSNYAY
jgi:hypothetical protein